MTCSRRCGLVDRFVDSSPSGVPRRARSGTTIKRKRATKRCGTLLFTRIVLSRALVPSFFATGIDERRREH